MNYNGAMKNSDPIQIHHLLQTAVFAVDEHLCFLWVNEAAEALLSHSLKRLQNKPFDQVIVDGDLTTLQLCQCFAQKGRWQLTNASLITLQQHWMHCQISLSFQHLNGLPVVIIEVLAAQDQHSLHKDSPLQDQSKATLSIVRNLAHEIKNPLSGLRGAAQLLQRKLSSELQKYTEIIVSEADRLQSLVDRMLTPAKPEAKVQQNIHELTERTLQLLEVQHHQQLKIKRDYDPSLPDLFIAPEQIFQALLNLVKNACEAMDHKGQLTIRTRAIHQHSIESKQYKLMIKIDVEDTGPGIEPELIDLIFLPTISGKHSSGLGLGIAQMLVQQNQGIIEFETEQGCTCFSLFLPVLPAQTKLKS